MRSASSCASGASHCSGENKDGYSRCLSSHRERGKEERGEVESKEKDEEEEGILHDVSFRG